MFSARSPGRPAFSACSRARPTTRTSWAKSRDGIPASCLYLPTSAEISWRRASKPMISRSMAPSCFLSCSRSGMESQPMSEAGIVRKRQRQGEGRKPSLAWNNPGNEGVPPSTRPGRPRSQRVPCAPAQRRPLRKLPGEDPLIGVLGAGQIQCLGNGAPGYQLEILACLGKPVVAVLND